MKKTLSMLIVILMIVSNLVFISVFAQESDEYTGKLFHHPDYTEWCTKIIDGVIYRAVKYNHQKPSACVEGFLSKNQSSFTIKDKVTFKAFNKTVPITSINIVYSEVLSESYDICKNNINNDNIKEITIPDTVKIISNFSKFKNLERVHIGKGLEEFNSSFSDCPKINFEIDKDNPNFIFDGKRILSKDKKTQYFEINPPKDYTVSKTLDNIYLNTNVSNIEIVRVKHNMKTVKCSVEDTKNLKELRFASNAKANIIDMGGCKKLNNVKYGKNQKTSGKFSWTKFKTFSFPSSITKIDEEAFYDNEKLTSIVIPSNVKTIGSGAFEHCKKLENVIIKSNKIKKIPNSVFCDTNIKYISIPKSVTTIEDLAFANCKKLKTVGINNTKSAPKIAKKAFEDTQSVIKFLVKNKNVAKQLKKNLKGSGVKKAKIYVGKKLVYKNVK